MLVVAQNHYCFVPLTFLIAAPPLVKLAIELFYVIATVTLEIKSIGLEINLAWIFTCICYLSRYVHSRRVSAFTFSVILLIAPEFVLRHYKFIRYFELRQIWNRLRFRIYLSWLALYCLYVIAKGGFVSSAHQHGDGGVNDHSSEEISVVQIDAILIACFPESIRSPVGYIGLCATVSCISSGACLLISMLVYLNSSGLDTKTANDGIDEFVWMLVVGLFNYFVGNETMSQVNRAVYFVSFFSVL